MPRKLMRFTVRSVLFGAWAMLLATGCNEGPRLVRVKGKVVHGGVAVKPDDNRSFNLIFTPESGSPDQLNRQVGLVNNSEGEFELHGSDNRGVPLGKYRVSFQVTDPSPSPRIRSLQDRFGKEPSPIIVEILDDKPLVLDLATYKSK